MEGAGGHVVMFPFPASGHIAPYVPFARSLARHGVAVTFLCPEHELARVSPLVDGGRGNVKLVTFEVPSSGGDGLNLISFDDLKKFMYDSGTKFEGIVADLMSAPRVIQYPRRCEAGAPVCIVSDMFLGFTQDMAEKLGIVRYCLFASPVHFLSLMFHLPKFNAAGVIPSKRGEISLVIPNFPPIPPGDLPPSQLRDTGHPGAEYFLLNEARQLWKAAGVLVNSVGELERDTIEGLERYLNENSPTEKPPRISTVGPLIEGLGDGELPLRQQLQENSTDGDCSEWLNEQPDASVLYVCFGTVAMVSDAQIREMASALESSNHRFLWVLRTKEDLSQVFPEGFLDRTQARGRVWLAWAPQLQILAHRAVRAFVSHCGWNSAVESLSLGVPMIAWPYQAEQMMNATLLDRILGVAIRINDTGGWRDHVASEVFEKAIRTLMVADDMKHKAVEISDVIEKAVRPGGSSWTNLESFVHDMRMLSSRSSRR